jgi:hypothetical protein
MLKFSRRIRKRHYVIFSLLIAIFVCTQMCTSRPGNGSDSLIFDNYGQAFSGSGLRQSTVPGSSSSASFAQGSLACQSCHREIYKSHIQTPHYQDSRPAAGSFIKGSFDSSRNRFVFNASTEVVMEQKDGRFFQTAYVNGKELRSEPFDIVIGSGKKGQTYLYYGDDGRLFQLPISYSTATDNWSNSPGYYPDSIRFNRHVTTNCLECHGTYAGTAQGDESLVLKSQIIYGIDCERCHGPGAEHVNYQTAHPEDHTAKYIVNPGSLPRQRRLDACALCHSGLRTEIRPAFSFRVGDTLSKFSGPGLVPGTNADLDVHGNQYGLLTASKCFIQSQMDCSSCHNVHSKEPDNPKIFSQKCMACHDQPAHNTCSMPPTPGLVLSDNCIDCHMPAMVTQKIALQSSGTGQAIISRIGKTLPILVRTHHIAIYPEITKQYLEKLKTKKTDGS